MNIRSMKQNKEEKETRQTVFFTEKKQIRKPRNPWKMISFALMFLLVAFSFSWAEAKGLFTLLSEKRIVQQQEALAEALLPEEGVELPIEWGDLGKQMVDNGVIDTEKLEALYEERGGMTEEMKSILNGVDGSITINKENANYILNLFWAFGLSNKNEILTEGEMVSEEYGADAGQFAATGGWSLATGDPMDHYSMHSFVSLTPEQQSLVEEVSKNVYRPCCDNPTHFPDCNHGMAMLGLLELLASQNLSENEMYEIALKVNAYWFPDNYVTIAQYFELKNIDWESVDAKYILSKSNSGGSGFGRIQSQIPSAEKNSSGGGCSV